MGATRSAAVVGSRVETVICIACGNPRKVNVQTKNRPVRCALCSSKRLGWMYRGVGVMRADEARKTPKNQSTLSH